MVLAYIILLPNSLGGGRVRVRITFTGNVIASGVTLIFFFQGTICTTTTVYFQDRP